MSMMWHGGIGALFVEQTGGRHVTKRRSPFQPQVASRASDWNLQSGSAEEMTQI
jgi:hypothetical protein